MKTIQRTSSIIKFYNLQNRSRPVGRPPHALNMERLWAGDYSQLPAGQQLHALNLSAQQQQQAWLGQHQGNKVNFI